MASADNEELERLRERLAKTEAELLATRAARPEAPPSPTEQSFRLMVEQMQEGAAVLAQGTAAVVYCNPRFAEMVGSSSHHLAGRLISPLLKACGDVSVEALLGDARPQRGDFELVLPSGQPLPVSISAMSSATQAGAMRCLVVSDSTDRLDKERLRRDAEALVQAEQRKNEFIAMLGHELRNPLAPIRNAVELLTPGVSPTSEQIERARTVIDRQVRHLTRLVDDLLDVGRITHGTLRLKRELVDIEDIVRVAAESVGRLIERRGHRLVIHVDPSEPLFIHGDPVRLTQLVTNLLSNAAKYTDDGGEIEVRVAPAGDRINITVIDNGRGIDEHMLSRVFDPFIQAQTSLERSAGGLGVGLALVKRIAELHEGTVRAESSGPNRGSQFIIDLPRACGVAPAPAPDPVPQPEPPSVAAKNPHRRVLVVDDNADAAEMMGLILAGRGHTIELAFDGEQALEVARAFVPEIICLDIGLPGLDGYEVARRLRKQEWPGRQPVLIALTGYGQPEDQRLSREAGFDHHLVKPASAEKIEQILASYEP